MDSTRDYSSIIHSPSFTFLVGPKHTRLTIQSGLAQHVSKPLHNLMNNGHTRESKHRIAVLEDEDVETFVAFCEYAYTGDYREPQAPVPQPETRTGVVENAPSPGSSWRQTYRSESVSSVVPPPAPSPPPETVEATSPTTRTPAEPEPTPVIEEDVSAEAAAEENDQPKEAHDQPKDENAEQEVADVFHESQETTVSSQPAADEEPNPAPANESDDWSSWQATSTPTGKKAKKDSKKKKKKREYQASMEEPPANLTPPSTPPPVHAEVEEIPPPEGTVEEPVAEYDTPEPGPIEQPELSAEPSAETPEEAPAEPEPEPQTTTLEPGPEEWEGTSASPPENHPDNPLEEEQPPVEGSWDEGTAEDQNDVNEPVESPPKPFIDMSFAKQPDSSPHTPGLSLWDEFTALRYNDDRPATAAAPVDVCTDDLPYLTFHAKVYVFATRYLIPALAQLCLRKLHRDLLHLTFADADAQDPSLDPQHLGGLAVRQAPMVLDLLRYAYTKTTRLEPISPTSATQLRENELRRLVVHYAACKVKELSRYHSSADSGMATPSARLMDSKVERAEDSAPKSLRILLDMTPELASDLVYRMM